MRSPLFILVALVAGSGALASVAPAHGTREGFALTIFVDGKPLGFGARVEAVIDDVDCTASTRVITAQRTVPTVGAHEDSSYSVSVFSADERPECGAVGRTIEWRVNGIPAIPTTSWPTESSRTRTIDVFVGPVPMILEGEVLRGEGLRDEELLYAFIRGEVCGIGWVSRSSVPREAGGFDSYSVVVLPSAIDPNCGHPGDSVQLRTGDQELADGISWREGRWRVPAAFGRGDGDLDRGNRWVWFVLGLVAGALAVASLGGFSYLVTKRLTRCP